MVVANAALGVDEIVGRPVLVLEGAPDGEIIVHGDRIVDAQAAHRVADVGLGLLEGELGRVDADDDQALVLVLLGPGANVGQGAQAVDAGVGPEIDDHDLAAQLLRRQGRGVDPGGGPGKCGQLALDREVRQIRRRRVHRRAATDAAQQRLFQTAGASGRNPGQQARVQAQADGDHANQHQGAQAAPHPFAEAQRALHGLEHPSADQQGQGQGGGGARRIGQQQNGRADARALQGRAGQDDAQDGARAGRPQQAGGYAQQQGGADVALVCGAALDAIGQPGTGRHKRPHQPIADGGHEQAEPQDGHDRKRDPATDLIGAHGPAAAEGRQGRHPGEGDRHADQQGQAVAHERPTGAGEDEGQDGQDTGADDGQGAGQIGEQEQDHEGGPDVTGSLTYEAGRRSVTLRRTISHR